MTVWFVPNYFYLSMPLFEKIIGNLTGLLKCEVLRVNSNRGVKDHIYDSKYFHSKNINYFEAPLELVADYNSGVIKKIKLLMLFYINMLKIDKLVRKHIPSAVVVGSDTANVNIKILLGLCLLHKIPIIILYNTDFNIPDRKKVKSIYSHSIWNVLNKWKLLVFIKALLYSCEVPGMFASNSSICVISDDIKRKLQYCGIKPERIFVVGLDNEMRNGIENDFILSIKKGIGKDRVALLAFFTECINKIYGNGYAKYLYETIFMEFQKLPQEIKILIKLHPREDQSQISFIKEKLSGTEYILVPGEVEAKDVIAVSDLIIAHFSKVLINAAMMGKRILSINLKSDQEKTFLSLEERHLLEIKNPEEITKKVEEIIYDKENNYKIDALIDGIAKKYIGTGNSIEKITQLILEKAGKVKYDYHSRSFKNNYIDGEKIKSF